MHNQQKKSGSALLRLSGLLLAALAALLPGSCIDDINLSVPSGEQGKLVIQGSLTHGSPAVVQIRISRSSDIRISSVPEAVPGAKVWLEEQEKGDTVMLLPAVKDGEYTRTITPGAPMNIAAGRSYRLHVITPDGTRYESDWEPLPDVPKADSLGYALLTRRELNQTGNLVDNRYIQFFINSPLQTPDGKKAFLKWDFGGAYIFPETPPPAPANPRICYVTQQLNLDKVALFDGAQSGSNQLKQFELFRETLDHRFGVAYYLTVFQQSLSAGAFRYWDQIGQVIQRTGSFFESPPGPIESNLHNADDPDEVVLGYFYARSIDTVRMLIEIPFDDRPATNCLPPVTEPGPYCQNCLLWPGSSRTKPDYWIE